MPLPAPAPPPPPPPPIPAGDPPKLSGGEQVNRNALLAQIRLGTHLKPSVTNDKSCPAIQGVKNGPNKLNNGNGDTSRRCNGPAPVFSPSDIFSQGMPRLKATGIRQSSPSEQRTEPPRKGSPPLPKAVRPANSFHSSSPLSIFQPPAQSSTVTNVNGTAHVNTSSKKYPAPGINKNSSSNLPSANSNLRGPPPAPPPQNQKPTHLLETNKSVGPSPEPAASNKLSASRPARPPAPPVDRPPPPPKSPLVNKGTPPAPPSKPPSIIRRQSIGSTDIRNGGLAFTQARQYVHPSGELAVTSPVLKQGGPPPPPRNMSAPINLNRLAVSTGNLSSSSMTSPPPPPPPSHSQTLHRTSSHAPPPPLRAAPIAPANRPGKPVARSPSVVPPPAPPPPPPHKTGMPHSKPAPPVPPNSTPPPPPPPTRNSSCRPLSYNGGSIGDDLEARFANRFHSIREFPTPDSFRNIPKAYQSHTENASNIVSEEVGDMVVVSLGKIKEENELCDVCWNNERDMVFLPCRHAACCEGCAKKMFLDNKPCPRCRQKIDSMVNVLDIEGPFFN